MKWLVSLILVLAIITGIFLFNYFVIYDYSDNNFITGIDKYARVPVIPLGEDSNSFYLISFDSDYLDPYDPTLFVQYPVKFMYRVDSFYFLYELIPERKQDIINYIYKNVHNGVANIPIVPEFFKISIVADVSEDSVSFNLLTLPPRIMYFNYGNYDYSMVEVYNGGEYVNNLNPNFDKYFLPFVPYINNIPLSLIFTDAYIPDGTDESSYMGNLISSNIYEFANTSMFDIGFKLNSVVLGIDSLGGMPELPVFDEQNNSGIDYVASYFSWVVDEIVYVFRYANAILGGIL